MTAEKEKNSETKSTSSKSIQKAAAEFLRGKPSWVLGVYVAARRFLYVAGPVLLWCIVLIFEDTISYSFVFGITIVMSVVLFLLSIPLSLISRTDLVLAEVMSFSGDSKPLTLVVALLYVFVNFVLIGAVRGALKDFRKKLIPR